MPNSTDEIYGRYGWLIEPLKASIPDLEVVIDDYGETVILNSRSLDKSLPLMLADRQVNAAGELDCEPGYDAIRRFNIKPQDHESTVTSILKSLVES